MRIGLLGPLVVIGDGGVPAEPAGRRLRTLLAVLACNDGRAVSTGTLQQVLWGEVPPEGAAITLRGFVHRLRRILGPARVRLHDGGYALHTLPGELDTTEFRSLTAQGRQALGAGENAAGVAALRAGLGLWRGPALDGLHGATMLDAAADGYEQRRLETLELCFDAELALGRADELVSEIQEVAARWPFRERLREQLMTALYRSGRQADALAEYRRAFVVLRDELGVEPGPALRQLHQKILAGESSSSPSSRATATAGPVVRFLPRTVPDFTGRDDIVSAALAAIAGSSAPAVLVVDGMAGSGKTTLALHLASLVGDRYPDAHLYVDLHGHSEQQPLTIAETLLVLLRQLGIAADSIPSDLPDRVDLWRSEVTARRLLVVLDNAASSPQVADLLPPAVSGLTLVTSRRRLAGLDGAHVQSLPMLTDDAAVALLARIVGDRVHAEADAARELARKCGGLPLAVRLAGARLAHRPGWRVADLLRRLDESVLPQLALENRTVADAFALSYRQLAEPARWAFRLLGLYPAATFDALAVAALTGLTLAGARDLLDELVDVHLVEESMTGVFRLHDLIREYAAMLAREVPERPHQ